MKVYFASDHAGFRMKNDLLNFVHDVLGHEVEDCGAHHLDMNDDYPTIIAKAASALQADAAALKDSRAIILGASGQGEAIVANRFKGVRAVVYYGEAGNQTDASGNQLDMIASTRQHNDGNALSIGARFLSQEDAEEAVRRWLSTPFSSEERHARRVRQIDEVAHG